VILYDNDLDADAYPVRLLLSPLGRHVCSPFHDGSAALLDS
jgi:hypothetical protein